MIEGVEVFVFFTLVPGRVPTHSRQNQEATSSINSEVIRITTLEVIGIDFYFFGVSFTTSDVISFPGRRHTRPTRRKRWLRLRCLGTPPLGT